MKAERRGSGGLGGRASQPRQHYSSSSSLSLIVACTESHADMSGKEKKNLALGFLRQARASVLPLAASAHLFHPEARDGCCFSDSFLLMMDAATLFVCFMYLHCFHDQFTCVNT